MTCSSCSVTSSDVLTKHVDEKRQYTMSFAELLNSDDSEIIEASPAPTVTDTAFSVGADALVITDIEINADEDGITVWLADGSVSRYRIKVTVTTSSGAILVGNGILDNKDK